MHQVKTTIIHDTHSKWNSPNTFSKVPLLYKIQYFCPQGLHRSSLCFTTLQNRGISHNSHQFFTSLTLHFASLPLFTHTTSLHVTSLIYTQNPLEFTLLVTIFLTLFLKVLNSQGKDASKPADNLFQLLMVLFTNEYLPTSAFLKMFYKPSSLKMIYFTSNHVAYYVNVDK